MHVDESTHDTMIDVFTLINVGTLNAVRYQPINRQKLYYVIINKMTNVMECRGFSQLRVVHKSEYATGGEMRHCLII